MTFEQRVATMPQAPDCAFASDNAAGAHPAVMQAVVDANVGHTLAYGSDPWTERATGALRDLFGADSEAFLVWNGTGANVMALATMVRPGDCVVCSQWAHIAVDETGAPERSVGAKLLTLPSPDAKLHPHQLRELQHLPRRAAPCAARGGQHHPEH